MRVYLRTAEPQPKFTMKVTFGPGFGENSGLTKDIIFLGGMAEVPTNVGQWLIDTGRASPTRYTILAPPSGIILPRSLHS